MTDNQITELLRKLLEERNVEWWESINDANCVFTWWESPMFGTVHAMDNEDGETLFMACLNNCDFTPEQAIAATLGRPKVKKVRGMTYDEHGGEVYFLACSGCGEWIDGDLDCIGEADGPSFCHHCGGEFDGSLLCKVCGELADMEFGDMCAECYWGEGEGNDER